MRTQQKKEKSEKAPVVQKEAAKKPGHPRSLYVLFFTEIWERFGFYTMLAIFTLYLNEKWKMSTGESSSLYGSFKGLVYLSPLLGGFLADRRLGHRRSVLGGAFLMGLGYLTMAIPRIEALYVAMALIIAGNGFFKPNISAMVGGLYPPDDPRRDAAFGIFYTGVNIGALFAPVTAGYLRSTYGWGHAFAAAGIGMFIGMFIFAIAGRKLGAHVPTVMITTAREQPEEKVEPKVAKERVRALLIMCGIVVFFWISFEQNGSTLTFWARDRTDLTIGGLFKRGLDPAMFGTINSFFVIALTPILLSCFSWLRKRGMEPTTPGKLGIGMIMTAASCGVMIWASLAGGDSHRVSAVWLVASYFTATLGELCLSPIGLSMVTKLAPRRSVALMLGFWYLGTAAGNKLAGEIGVFWDKWWHHEFFTVLMVGCLGSAGLLALNLKRLNAAMPKDEPRGATAAASPTFTAVVTVAAVEGMLAEQAQADSATESDPLTVAAAAHRPLLPS